MTQHTTIERAKQLIKTDLAESKELSRACHSIVDFISKRSNKHLQHLTFGMLAKVCGGSQELGSRAIAYLTGDRARTLQICFEFIDDKNEIYPTTANEIQTARNTGSFLHPDDGEPVLDFEKHIYVYFIPAWLTDGVNK